MGLINIENNDSGMRGSIPRVSNVTPAIHPSTLLGNRAKEGKGFNLYVGPVTKRTLYILLYILVTNHREESRTRDSL